MKKSFFRMVVFCFIFLLSACGATDENAQKEKKQADIPQEEQASEKNGIFPVTVTDGVGNKVTIKERPERIVSLLPSNTEIAFAVGAGERIVGVSKFADYPEEVKTLPKVGGQQFNVEKVVSLKPDVVLALDSHARNAGSALDQLRAAGAKVIAVQSASSFSDVYENIRLIGKVTGNTKQAEKLIARMKKELEAVKRKAEQIQPDEQVSVWIEVSPPPHMYTTGKNTFMHQMLEMIHAQNIAAEQKGWVPYTAEAVVKQKPDVIILTYGGSPEKVKERSGWSQVPAVQNGRIYSVNSDLVSRPGPRLIKGVKELASVIYPDIFEK